MSRQSRKEKKINKQQNTIKICVQRKHKQKRYVLPFVKKTDNFTQEQIKPILNKTIFFGFLVSLSIITTIAFVVFVVLAVGIDLILTDNRQLVTFISFALWFAVVCFFLLSYWKLGEIYRLVRKYRKENSQLTQNAELTEQNDEGTLPTDTDDIADIADTIVDNSSH